MEQEMGESECMEILVEDDDDDDFKGKGGDQSDEDAIYECDFDINDAISETLNKLDIKSQVADAFNNLEAQLDFVERRILATNQAYDLIGTELKKSHVEARNLLLPMTTRPMLAKPQTAPVQGTNQQQQQHLMYVQSAARQQSTSTAPQAASTSKKPTDNLDVIPVARVVSRPPNVLPVGTLVKKELTVGMRVYSMKGSIYGVWNKAKITEIKNFSGNEEKQYKVYRIKFESKKMVSACLPGRQLAYHDAANVQLPVGTRVIAQYRDEYWSQTNSMYAGIIAEPPKVMNSFRYLVFFDDGYAQYVQHCEVRVVCEASREVWEDIHPDSKEFIKNYLKQYPERPMVKLQTGHIVKTEWNGKWWIAKVMEVDASLVKMYFNADKRTEWIYRGSTRLGPLYSELAMAEAIRLSGKGGRRHTLMTAKKRSAPYVEYTRGLDEPTGRLLDSDTDSDYGEKKQTARKQTTTIKSNVAKKSTTAATSPMKIQQKSVSLENEGVIEFRPFTSALDRMNYVAHICSNKCLKGVNDTPSLYKGHNPLSIPLRCGWERQIVRHKGLSKRIVFYKAPCGRRLRSIEEIFTYLGATNSNLTIDTFCTDSYVNVVGEFVPSQVLRYIKDISYGKENVCVSGVNSLGREYPEYVEYSTKRIPNKGVNLNLDPEFLVGCDCEDNCANPETCKCRQLTIEATQALPNVVKDSSVGYHYRRLRDHITTGIYECNQRCKCNYQCLNRVVQNGLTLRLQVFKTDKRGWGIRCLDDIPKGGFICIYAGQLLTEQGANEDGTQYGDEYLAELDYIEVVEAQKEGYEKDVVDPDAERKSGDEDDANWEDNKRASDYHSSDSDFEAELGEIVPRVRSTRKRGGETKSDEKAKDVVEDSEKPARKTSTQSDVSTSEIPATITLVDSDSDENSKTSKASSSDQASVNKKDMASKGKTYWTIPGYSKSVSSPSHPGLSESNSSRKFPRQRSYFGDEFCYIMDAKSLGNIGRYLNHNCTPNVFVQNVFVDTHDLRFPWVAFFALQYIRAGTELTWDYNYDVNSVPGKVLYCECGSSECRGRLL